MELRGMHAMLARSGLLLALATTWAKAEPAGEISRTKAGVPAPAAVYCTLSESLMTMSWARVSGAAGYQVWQWSAEGAAEEKKPGWTARERLDPDRGRLKINRTGGALPRLAVSSLFVEGDRVVSSAPIPAVFTAAPDSVGAGMPFPFPRWAIPPPDREEVELGLYRERREDALIDLILQQGFRFTRWVFLAGKSKLKPRSSDSGQRTPGKTPETGPPGG